MKKEIKSLPAIKIFSDYLVCRGKRVLNIKSSEYDHFQVNVTETNLEVWFFKKTEVIAWAKFTPDGRCYTKKVCI